MKKKRKKKLAGKETRKVKGGSSDPRTFPDVPEQDFDRRTFPDVPEQETPFE